MEPIKIIAIVGSLRRDSLNRQLAMEAGRLLANQAQFELLEYSDVPLFNQDYEHLAPDPVRRVREQILAADGIWIFTPEYNHFFPGVLKNLLDWLSRPVSETEPNVLRGKPVVISGITPGMSGTGLAQDHLITLLSILNMRVMTQPRVTIPYAMQQMDSSGHLSLSSSAAFLEKQANDFVWFVRSGMG